MCVVWLLYTCRTIPNLYMASPLLMKMMILAFFLFLMVLSSMSSPLPPPPSSLCDGLSFELIPSHSLKSLFYYSNLVNPLVSLYKQDLVVKIGIGTIDIEGDVAYKSYLLALDTGSDLIWIQCEKCKIQDENHRCYPQKEEPFSDSKSRTYQPLPSSHPLCKPVAPMKKATAYTR
ncbi:hypothetical protein Ahy_A04g018305 [Arachis hypogaea]|uniref:Peptidase A1 domain-containing protein n=1 Tax=Arachis hypogaea TaxID=3818 RepID=A0A445DDD4_ARAHY|nr:hypothetical protein Ahy_A04g018305 [Arachis hypogaea]